MATNIKHTLYNLEVTPPPGVWPDIAARLGTEFDANETPVAQKMFDFSVTPPPGMWTDIAAQLNTELNADEAQVSKKLFDLSVTPPAAVWEKIATRLFQQPVKKEGKLITLHSWKAITAAAAMVLLTVGAWYFLDKTNSVDNTTVARQSATSTPAGSHSTTTTRTRTADTEIGERAAEQIDPINSTPLAALSGAETDLLNNRYANRHGARRTAFFDYQPIATSYAGVDEDHAIEFTDGNQPNVEAPLIRDANGQVILDKKLVAPDECYITITSPNGEQTRISSKFLHIISTLNQEAEPQDYFDFMMQENSLWKIRFSEWKEKFLNQASQVTTPTSFTDIMDLKDLLMENQ